MTDRNNSNNNNLSALKALAKVVQLDTQQTEDMASFEGNIGPETGHVILQLPRTAKWIALSKHSLESNKELAEYILEAVGELQVKNRNGMKWLMKGACKNPLPADFIDNFWRCVMPKEEYTSRKANNTLPGLDETRSNLREALKLKFKEAELISGNMGIVLSALKTHEEAKQSHNHNNNDRNDGGANGGAGMVF